jgi:hypothetical protein
MVKVMMCAVQVPAACELLRLLYSCTAALHSLDYHLLSTHKPSAYNTQNTQRGTQFTLFPL